MKQLPYNRFMTSLALLILSLVVGTFSWIITPNLPKLAHVFSIVSASGISLGLLSLFALILYSKKHGISIGLSLWVTWRLRRYCHFESPNLNAVIVTNQLPPSTKVITQVNRSLLTLTVTLTATQGLLHWHLPLTHEAHEKLENLFPKVKIELNHHAKHYLFNDITRLKGNLYHANGFRQ